ncbi:catalase [Salmonella enterica subsp. enterica serovar Enteritidis]|nr:catalase [Salmonella enterica subsp. enterica serovar Enteritidis]
METIGPDEQRLINEIVEQMAAANLAAFNRHNHGIRDAHAKSHGFLKGTLTVHDDLDAELRQGVFAKPKRYEVVARLSSAPGDIHSDEIPAPRGFALKLIGVEGERLSPDIGGRNQDFLMVNFPVLAFGDVARYKEMLGLLEANAQAPDFFQKLVAGAARGAKDVVEALGGAPGATLEGLARNNDNPLGESYFTQGALRFGDYIGKVSIAPASPNIKALTGQPIEDVQYSTIRDVVRAHFLEQDAEYTVRVQLCADLKTMPVEDAAVLWDEAVSPQRPVATLRFERQDAYSPARRVYGDDILAFNPWNGVAAHQPLGSIMRVRKAAYERSSQRRHAMNAVARAEPESLAAIPD